MNKHFPVYINYLLVIFLFLSCKIGPNPEQELEKIESKVDILPPGELYGDLFYDVQTNTIFSDSKTFVDAKPQYNVGLIRQRYNMLEDTTKEGISDFVKQHFELPGSDFELEIDSSSIKSHISKLWNVLKRPSDERKSGTLIPLPKPYIVPGGRFREIYYWDSYFTMLGLQEDREVETIQNMVDNFAFLINEYGFIPNGNRTYYLGRSQPPFFAMMVKVLSEIRGEQVLAKYLPELEREYNFWMDGSETFQNNNAVRRVVKMKDGEILNRYWDDNATPRPESYREDVKTAEDAIAENPALTKEEVYRNLRAGAESGWDFSSRWLHKNENGQYDLSTIHTTDIVPVDLNSLLYNLEMTISEAARISGNQEKSKAFSLKAENRKQAILKYNWDSEAGFFKDYNFKNEKVTGQYSLAGVYPLFFEIATKKQAESVANKIEKTFLKPGGLVTTPYNTGEQWDAPNGWPPLQWLSIKGLKNYNQNQLAMEIRSRWLKLNKDVYNRTFKMLEKYNVEDLTKESGGGEYPTQDGFGWTNGVYQKLSSEN
ncbi:alpha,alpha-trehalase TreF [Christiangramia forsetii]|uniref:Trehalase n=2 Tax=Christiangramia forsetii TaxID=411153 RepID=A0LZD7_CHRFK|nr:alpha,alpha-trehalase TreF [Christiangramia forsetii]GGG38065.1 periplasmic trehalase [Christiangramia forsetii]CAL65732.1 trehalase [Christiangramia forsetii KT0803]